MLCNRNQGQNSTSAWWQPNNLILIHNQKVNKRTNRKPNNLRRFLMSSVERFSKAPRGGQKLLRNSKFSREHIERGNWKGKFYLAENCRENCTRSRFREGENDKFCWNQLRIGVVTGGWWSFGRKLSVRATIALKVLAISRRKSSESFLAVKISSFECRATELVSRLRERRQQGPVSAVSFVVWS